MNAKQGLFRLPRILGTVAVLAALMLPSTATSQDVAVGQATATVLAVLAVSATTGLDFGNVYQGVSVTAAKDNSTTGTAAGVFTITGAASADIAVYMQMPEYLATSSGDDRMVISFNSTDAAFDTTGNVDPASFATGVADVDPYNWGAAATNVGSTGTSAIFLGGAVIPSVNQTAGAYTGDIIVTVSYIGT
ncbi:MAG: hypothetical protein KKA42_13170 [candidate division Zixibacteria bacterium]|nr:hypothetical protein [candidate division Zixibacteria bacterium]